MGVNMHFGLRDDQTTFFRLSSNWNDKLKDRVYGEDPEIGGMEIRAGSSHSRIA